MSSTTHQLQIRAQAHANVVRVMPEPKSPIVKRSNGMTSTADQLQIRAQAHANAVRVMPEPKPTADARPDSMTASYDTHFGNRA
jgi:hypothetical protein